MNIKTLQLLIIGISITYFLISVSLIWYYVYCRLPKMRRSLKRIDHTIEAIEKLIHKDANKKC